MATKKTPAQLWIKKAEQVNEIREEMPKFSRGDKLIACVNSRGGLRLTSNAIDLDTEWLNYFRDWLDNTFGKRETEK